MRTIKRLTLGCMLFLLGSFAACAPRDSGFGSVQVLLDQRAGIDARWKYLSGEDAADQAVTDLLSQPVGPEEAVQVALMNNADLQAVFEDLGIARVQLLAASLPPNIVLDGNIASVRGRDRSEFDFAATTDLSRLLFLPLRRGVATAELDATRFGTAGAVLEFAYTVRNAYYDYQAAEQLLELDRTVVEAAAASYDAARRLQEAGNITALELANEEVFYEEARSEAALAEAAALNRREELHVLMGLSGADTNWELVGRMAEPVAEDPELAGLEERAIEQSLDLLELENRYVAAARRATLARAEGLLPSLRAGVQSGREEGLREIGPVISVELPLFNRGQDRVEMARAEMRQLEQQYRARAVGIRAASRAARNNLRVAARRIEHYRSVLLPLREQIIDQTQRQYNAMQVGVFQLVVARREQIQTGQEYVVALRDYWRARNTLDQILAGRLVRGAPDLGLPMVRDLGRR